MTFDMPLTLSTRVPVANVVWFEECLRRDQMPKPDISYRGGWPQPKEKRFPSAK